MKGVGIFFLPDELFNGGRSSADALWYSVIVYCHRAVLSHFRTIFAYIAENL